MLTIYWNLASQPARAVKALADLGKLEAEFVHLDIFKGQTHKPDFTSKNPFGKVPYITHGDFGLAQSNAILVYLCETFPQKLGKYYGNTTQQRALVNQYLSWYQGTFRPGLLRPIYLKMEKTRKKIPLMNFQIQRGQELVKETLNELEQILTKNTPFITGANLTIADLLVFHELTNAVIYEFNLEEYKAVNTYFKHLQEIEEIRAIYSEWEKIIPNLTGFLGSIKADDV